MNQKTELSKKAKSAVAKFLNTEAGVELLQHIRWNTPKVGAAAEPHIMHFNAGTTQGWTNCTDLLESLSVLQSPASSADEPDSLER